MQVISELHKADETAWYMFTLCGWCIIDKSMRSFLLVWIITIDSKSRDSYEKKEVKVLTWSQDQGQNSDTGRERLIRSHSSARFCFELSGNSN